MITSWRTNPLIYEINTWSWLYGLSQQHGQPVTLGTVPEAALEALTGWGFDAIWLMGVWERSPRGREIARAHPGLQGEYRDALRDFTPEDVSGSPYSIHRYEVDPQLGGRDELAALRRRLAERGLRLILDYVPNHVAQDHPWLDTNPEFFVHGTGQDLAARPDHFFRYPTARHQIIFANGRDPYFPAWTDTAQINAFSPQMRQQAVETLRDIAAQCDGVRCDMAMLVTNRVFAQTWGERAGVPPSTEFWHDVIPPVRAQHPHFLFMAEVYWDMEWELQQQGFDYTYDKRLYDRLLHDSVEAITLHLHADRAYQDHLIRFVENHDEGRAARALGPDRARAGAALVATLPGGTLIHEGQMQGHRVKLPVQLRRRPPEPDQPDVEAFYRCLLAEANHPVYHEGVWRLREPVAAWDDNPTFVHLIAYTWQHGDERGLVVINYSDQAVQGTIPLPDFGLAGRVWMLHDALDDARYERDGDLLDRRGLYVDLAPWQVHLFRFEPQLN